MDMGAIVSRGRLSPARNRDRRDHVAFEHTVHHIHACGHTGKDGVLVVEPEVIDEVHEDLAVTGVMTAG